MEEKLKLERDFSAEYRETYITLHVSISELVKNTRKETIPMKISKRDKRKKKT